ncbi:MAG: YesL family protein [bacterium]|jgi:uncharacterized membrane protein YesL
MKSFLNPESPPMKFLTAIGYAACLNCFWFLCCLPVVTAGASTTALYDVMQKVVLSEESRIISSFFASFRKNFRQATKAFLVLLAAGIFLGVDGYILFHLRFQGAFWTFLTAVWLVMMAAFCIILLYIFPLMARFENTTFLMIKNSLMTGMHFLYCTVIIAAFHFAVGYIIINVYTPVLFLGEGLCALFSAWIMKGVILRLEEMASPSGDASGEETDAAKEDNDKLQETGDLNDETL